MEIGENENQNPSIEKLHETQSVPIFSSSDQDGQEGSIRKKSRRVSFASSTQYLEPLNPFATLGKWTIIPRNSAMQCRKTCYTVIFIVSLNNFPTHSSDYKFQRARQPLSSIM